MGGEGSVPAVAIVGCTLGMSKKKVRSRRRNLTVLSNFLPVSSVARADPGVTALQ